MSRLKLIAAGAGGVGVLVLMGAGSTWMWANSAVTAVFDKDWESHEVDFPIPFPLTEAEKQALRDERTAEMPEPSDGEPVDPLEGVDLDAIAMERAVARGQHYVTSIYACTACHGADFGGGSMIDDGAIGQIFGPNLTKGGKTASYRPADWDRAVRHGILPNGKTSMMPVLDFKRLTDRELSDMAAFIGSLPAKEGGETVRTWGPIGTMLVATGQLVPDVERVKDHMAAHEAEPPVPTPDAAYGTHIINVCTGCHREGLNGGPMPFGPPDWPPAANLTPHESGIAGWSFEDFEKALKTAVRPDGRTLQVPMSELIPFANNMTDTELRAMYAYLVALPPTPTGE
ncbi:MAG: c-type cytochrome [Alphaproteobacteria bacterium]|nr:c-type cytochrome [Alphaproteobacteria bacterium]